MLELLQVLRDAIKAHRSLFQDAQILHQDVSAQNIIIVDSPGQQGSRGIMIDLDVAQNLAEGPRTPGEVTGTRPFMSIGILRRRRHTYRHDLESFLYVLLWTVISNGAQNPPRTSALRQWNQGTWDESAMRKTQDMTDTNFGRILAEFNPEHQLLKPVAENMRQLLFPIKDEAIWTGTDSSPKAVNELYDGIIDAFEVAISQQKILKISMPPTDTC
ncbi:Tyrosine-protein kinase, active site [Penicillium camemberti]|uniref:EKC/KEOPS complex subunit BUD32 n=1 Tax=Penicillium camemberti (strain FM 013) TaxID=1429867 RepID=A0A0G4P921_PENC3|nr:Tyrosine-protein kinase, active site [Penicillium camemberti]